ncbi:C40 family peptidase [Lachnospiraceae bacterium 50-23]|jgi:hypothetical protein|nr:C40 family peptidase [Dorea sp.]GFI36462.1 putative endopeptidase [Lachnospiraceae bacterium]
MDSILKKGLFLVTFSGAFAGFSVTAQASDTETVLPSVGIEEVLSDCYSSEKEIQVEDYLVPTEKGEYLDMAFADVQSFLYIRSEPTKESEWVGKLYPDYAAEIIGPVGEWTPVRSGDVTGYVCSDYIIIGKNAEEKAQEIIEETQAAPEESFTYAESREEEEARLAEEAKEEAEQMAGTGQAVVDYACQFIGNPYVWGGTSLTNGADCSGFVQSVYKHFGITLPRTSGEMRSSGRGVSYSEAIPGDIVCYDGHVGIYMGDGQIVNAINSRKGIGILPATYTNIITVRRLI